MKVVNVDFDIMGLSAESRVLDVGCGRGQMMIPLLRTGHDVKGIDLNEAHLQEIAYTPDLPTRPSLQVASAESLPFADECFDIVMCREVLEHTHDPAVVLMEIHRVLRPGGYLYISVPWYVTERLFQFMNPEWLAMAGHVQVFSIKGLRELLQSNGYDVVKMTREASFYTYFWFFHCIFRTRHDGAGRPLHHHRLTSLLQKTWNRMAGMRGGTRFVRLLDRLMPKSIYVYSRKGDS